MRAVDGLLTGWHEPEASHLLMLEAVAGRRALELAYAAALAAGYLWHEFGDPTSSSPDQNPVLTRFRGIGGHLVHENGGDARRYCPPPCNSVSSD